jgi:hypothetical protein
MSGLFSIPAGSLESGAMARPFCADTFRILIFIRTVSSRVVFFRRSVKAERVGVLFCRGGISQLSQLFKKNLYFYQVSIRFGIQIHTGGVG